jgi:plastocyanin
MPFLRATPTVLIAIAASAALVGCGGAEPERGDATAAAGPVVAIEDFKYAPTPLTVKAGTTVKIANRDAAQHTLTAADAFDSGTIEPTATGSVTFKTAGTFAYICQFHPFMKGTVTVTA